MTTDITSNETVSGEDDQMAQAPETLPELKALIESGDYNDNKLPTEIVPGLENVDREIPTDSFRDRVDKVQREKAAEMSGEPATNQD